jgi:hypothetical protein
VGSFGLSKACKDGQSARPGKGVLDIQRVHLG